MWRSFSFGKDIWARSLPIVKPRSLQLQWDFVLRSNSPALLKRKKRKKHIGCRKGRSKAGCVVVTVGISWSRSERVLVPKDIKGNILPVAMPLITVFQ